MHFKILFGALLFGARASAEAECQDLDNCPHCYNNTQPDYDPNDPSGLVVSDDLVAFMDNTMNEYLRLVQTVYPPSQYDSDATVFNGLGGRALLYLRLYDGDGDADNLQIALEYIESSLSSVNTITSNYCGFLWGRTGVYSVAAAIYDRLNNTAKVQEMVTQVVNIFEASQSDSQAPYDDWDAGRGGLLFASPYLDRNTPNYQKAYNVNGGIISRELMVNIATAVVNRGNKLSDAPGQYLQWVSPNDGGKWLGQSHGSAGVLHGLLLVPEVYIDNATARGLILGTLDHIVSLQQPSGNFPTEYYNPSDDVLVQWDHGAPGVMAVLSEAAYRYSNTSNTDAKKEANTTSWMNSAIKAADCTWERGLLVKGLQLCHGISGNTYMQITLAQWLSRLNDNDCDNCETVCDESNNNDCDPNKYIWRAIQFQNFVSVSPDVSDPEYMRKPTPNPYEFYTASYEAGAVTFGDLIANAETPIRSTMPLY